MAEPDAGRKSFEEFAAGALPALLRFGHVLTGSPAEAEDLVQEAATAVAVPLALSGAGSPPAPAAAGHVQATPLTQPKATSILMPDVTGLKLKNAEALIRSVTGPVHLVIRHVKVPHHGGTVVRQVPSPGARVSPDGQITITVTVYEAG